MIGQSAECLKMANGERLKALVTDSKHSLLMVIWLILVQSMFFNWGAYIHPVGESLTDIRQQQDELSHLIYLFFAACILLLFLSRPIRVARILLDAWPIMLFVLWIFLSASWGKDPSVSIAAAFRFALLIIFAAYMVSNFEFPQFVSFLTRGFAIAVAASLAVFVIDPHLAFSGLGGGYQSAWRGSFPHKNWLGSAMSIGVFMSAYSYRLRANSRFISISTFLGCLALLLLSRSATSLVAAAASGLMALFGGAWQSTGRRAPLRALAYVGIVAIAVVALAFPLTDLELKDAPNLLGRSSDLTGRTEVWRAVRMVIRERPMLGQGYGFWTPNSDEKNDIWTSAEVAAPHAHNTWLDVWLQLGLVGLVMSALVWAVAFRRAISLVLGRYGHGSLFCLVILVGCFTKSFTEEILIAPALTSTFWLATSYMYLGVILKQRYGERNAQKILRPIAQVGALPTRRHYLPQ
jgi:O-antigen ligase